MDRRTADDLDRYITGNYGEDGCREDDPDTEPTPIDHCVCGGTARNKEDQGQEVDQEADPTPTGAVICFMLAAFCGFCVGLATAGAITILVLRAHHVL